MRPDVKLGLVISMVVVLVAGGYFLYRGNGEASVAVTTGPDALTAQVAEKSPENVHRDALGEADRSRATPSAPNEVEHPMPPGRSVRPDGRVVAGEGTPLGRQTRSTRPVTSSPTRHKEAGATTPGDVAKRVSDAAPARKLQPADVRRQQVADRTANRRPDAGAARPRGAQRTKQPSSDRSISLAAPKSPPQRSAKQPDATKQAVAVDTHRVQPGDTLSSLAKRYYGSERFTRFLIDGNPQLEDPNRLAAGAIVKIPPRPAHEALSRPASTTTSRGPSTAGDGRRTYLVQPGDSFYAIARDVLHDASRWKELFELNKDLVKGDPTSLQIGQVIVLPPP